MGATLGLRRYVVPAERRRSAEEFEFRVEGSWLRKKVLLG